MGIALASRAVKARGAKSDSESSFEHIEIVPETRKYYTVSENPKNRNCAAPRHAEGKISAMG